MTPALCERYVLGTAETAELDVAHVYAPDLTPQIAAGLREMGGVVHANDALGRDGIDDAIEAGAQSLSTDDVALAMEEITSAEH